MVKYNAILDVQDVEGSSAPLEPVTLQEAKDFCKIDISTDDDLIEELITTAREMCESFTNIGFINLERIVVLNNGNGGQLLPYGPVTAIDEVIVDEEVLSSDEYTTSGNEFKRLITPTDENIQITYTSGYDVLSKRLKTGLLNQIFYLYDNRAQSVDGISPIAMQILKPLQRV
jgi:uncharacterized phiE125 gp8 family phage protein